MIKKFGEWLPAGSAERSATANFNRPANAPERVRKSGPRGKSAWQVAGWRQRNL